MSEQIEVKATGGVGAFFWSMCIWAVAIGVLAWIGVAQGCIAFHHARTLADRMDNRVGVVEPLKNPVKLFIRRNQGCYAVSRAFADGNSITIYIHNGCNAHPFYAEWHLAAKAPDGTIISQDWKNTLNAVSAGETEEQTIELPNDDRIDTIEVWASSDNH